MHAQALLSDTRAEVYRASIYVRDALLDPEPQPARYRADVETAYRQADDLLSQYVPVLGAAIRTRARGAASPRHRGAPGCEPGRALDQQRPLA